MAETTADGFSNGCSLGVLMSSSAYSAMASITLLRDKATEFAQ